MKSQSILKVYLVIGTIIGGILIILGLGAVLSLDDWRELGYRSQSIMLSMAIVSLLMGIACVVWSYYYFRVPGSYENEVIQQQELKKRVKRGASAIICFFTALLVHWSFSWLWSGSSEVPYDVALYRDCMGEREEQAQKNFNLPPDRQVHPKLIEQLSQRRKLHEVQSKDQCTFFATLNSAPWKSKSDECIAGVDDSTFYENVAPCLRETLVNVRDLLVEKKLITDVEGIDNLIASSSGLTNGSMGAKR